MVRQTEDFGTASSARAAVPSEDPSSMTKTGAWGRTRFIEATTSATAPSSLKAGTMTSREGREAGIHRSRARYPGPPKGCLSKGTGFVTARQSPRPWSHAASVIVGTPTLRERPNAPPPASFARAPGRAARHYRGLTLLLTQVATTFLPRLRIPKPNRAVSREHGHGRGNATRNTTGLGARAKRGRP